MSAPEYRYTTGDLMAEFGLGKKALLRKVRALGIGINLDGSAGFRYSEEDRRKLIESMRIEAPVAARRRRRAA